MSSTGVPKGKETEGAGIGSGSKVNVLPSGTNEMGIPHGQSPGLGRGNKEASGNALTSNAHVRKPATSNLMTGVSQTRGSGGK